MSEGVAEATIVESEAQLRAMLDGIPDTAVVLLDPAGRVATWSAAAARLDGHRAADIVGRHSATFYPDGIADARCDRVLADAHEHGRGEDEGWRLRADGTRYWAAITLHAERGEAGELLGFVQVVRDLTAKKHVEQRRRMAEDRYATLVDSIGDCAIVILDTDGRIATWNACAQRIVGYAATDIVNDHFSRFSSVEAIRAGTCEHELALAAEQGRFEGEGWRVRADGSRFWAQVVIGAIHDENGMLTGFVHVLRDLSERRRIDEERAARAAAEEASRLKDDVLSSLGHELRDPLAPILTAVQIIKLRAESRNAREHAVIERQTKHVMRLVDDLVDVARVARGTIELRTEPIDVRDAIAKAIEEASHAIEMKGCRLEVEVPHVPLPVDGDEARLVQVFAHLLANAARYTPERGLIGLTVRRRGDRIIAEVKDTGEGVAPEQVEQLFELFAPGAPGVPGAAGRGLGLGLVRSLVRLHGGELEARSAGVGFGSTFTVTLPTLPQAVLAADADPADFTDEVATRDGRAGGMAMGSSDGIAIAMKRRIFVVDDNDDARVLLVDLLQSLGHDVRDAPDGRTALAMVGEFRPDVAILDLGLPEMDGYELAQAIRASAPPAGPPRLIALTGYGGPAERERSKAAGFDEHLVKPVDIRSLLEHVRG